MQHVATFNVETRLLTVTDEKGRQALSQRVDESQTFTDVLPAHGFTLKPGTVWNHQLGSLYMGAELESHHGFGVAPEQPPLDRTSIAVTRGELVALLVDFATHEVTNFSAVYPELARLGKTYEDIVRGTQGRAESLLATRGFILAAVR